MKNIVWLASYPKSGNTWMRVFLSHIIWNATEPMPLDQLGREGFGDQNKEFWAEFSGGAGKELPLQEGAKLIPQVHRAISRLGHYPVVCKTHQVNGDIFGIPLITPEFTAGAIYIVRNPLDVCISYANHRGEAIDQTIEHMANPNGFVRGEEKVFAEIHSSWSNHVKSWTAKPTPGLLVVRYEDMLAHPLETFTKVAAYLQYNRTEEEIKRAIEFSSFDRLREEEAKAGFKEASDRAPEQFFRQGQAGAWREKLSKAQVDKVINAHKEQMTRFGYLDLKAVPAPEIKGLPGQE